MKRYFRLSKKQKESLLNGEAFQIKFGGRGYGRTHYEMERLKFKCNELLNTLNRYRYYPERLKEEMIKLEKEINDYNFVGMNKECYAYKVAMEKLQLIKQIYYIY